MKKMAAETSEAGIGYIKSPRDPHFLVFLYVCASEQFFSENSWTICNSYFPK